MHACMHTCTHARTHTFPRTLQVMADAKVHTDGDFESSHTHIKRGDVIGLVGYPGKSKKGELSVFPVKTRLEYR